MAQKRIHFGSLEVAERLGAGQSPVAIVQESGVTLDQLASASLSRVRAQTQQNAVLKDLEKKKIQHTIAVPTDDFKVRKALRDLGQPITYFGEGVYHS